MIKEIIKQSAVMQRQISKFELDYFSNLGDIADKLAGYPYTIWLDSCHPYSQQGRYELLVTDPAQLVIGENDQIKTQSHDGKTQIFSGNPFDSLEKILMQYPKFNHTDVFFCGGFVGYFAYDLGRLNEVIPNLLPQIPHFNNCLGGIYLWGIVSDHFKKTTEIIGILPSSQLQELWQKITALPASDLPGFKLASELIPMTDKASYQKSFKQAKQHIAQGDCYQINLSQAFLAQHKGHAWHAYLALRKNNPTPFAAYINAGDYQILSCSPERFIKIENNDVITNPIKGTARRHENSKIDKIYANKLKASIKNQAENIMIVDLMRNDLSRNCVPGSVKVPKLCNLESFNQVHHLVSTVTGQLDALSSPLKCLRDSFPGGSITGAPKIRAMQIIETLETCRRGIYCGSIGYYGFNNNLDTSIAIRTMISQNHTLKLYAGGAIVADSECHSEYQECYTKIKAISQTLNQL